MESDRRTARLRERILRLGNELDQLHRAICEELDWRDKVYSYDEKDDGENDRGG
jgi:hypothetical protein